MVLRDREHVLRALAARLIEVETMDAAEMDRIIADAESKATIAATVAIPEPPPAEAAS